VKAGCVACAVRIEYLNKFSLIFVGKGFNNFWIYDSLGNIRLNITSFNDTGFTVGVNRNP